MIGYPPSIEYGNELRSLTSGCVLRQDHLMDATLANSLSNRLRARYQQPRARAETQKVENSARRDSLRGLWPPSAGWYRGQADKF